MVEVIYLLFLTIIKSRVYKFINFNPITILAPQINNIPIIASIPHSGMYIPEEVKKLYTSEHMLRLRNTDWFLQELYDFLPAMGISVVQANFNRYAVDVNRPPCGIAGEYNRHAIYTTDTWGDDILTNPNSDLFVEQRMNNLYRPYHSSLSNMIGVFRQKYGQVYVLDMHSFGTEMDDDICLGARRNNRTAPNLQPLVKGELLDQFSKIAENKKYSGGHITQHYGAMDGVEVLQIELSYKSYLKNGTYDGDQIPVIDLQKFIETKQKLKKALENVSNALKVTKQNRVLSF